jgi:4-hydroxy-tetrahydrodipicolinate synthase
MRVDASGWDGRLIPAVPVPFGHDGEIDESASIKYAEWMIQRPIGGVAVWAHTGRGLKLSESQQDQVLAIWRRTLPAESVLVAAAGSRSLEPGRDAVIASAAAMARRAADLGADALLAHPPASFRDDPGRDALILDYHQAIAESGLPIVLFYLYEAAGGISYSPELLAKLLALPQVVGIKVATLDSVMTFQDIARVVRRQSSPKALITGEDRFLAYSLMSGARAALIGMGAACIDLQAELLASHLRGDAARFLKLSELVDDLAQHTFIAPMEGYIQRMLWCLVHEGVISIDAAHDPWGPALDPAEFDRLGRCVKRVTDAFTSGQF